MTRAKRPVLSTILSLFGWIVIGILIWKIPPLNWFVEISVLTLLGIVFFLTSAWVIGNWKKGLLFSTALLGLLVMNRLQILDILTGGLWLLVFGLISLVI